MTSALARAERHRRRVVFTIATSAGIASLAMNFWMPFLPLYMLHLGATSNANALFWVAVATTCQGVARLVSAPLWGVLSDRVGRKVMLIRALYFATGTTAIACFATEPWHVAVALGCQGLFSGFIPAAVALTSVSVPEERLGSSVATVTGSQYVGNTVGPALGAMLAIAFGMRGAIAVSALMPAIAATMVVLAVPRDRIEAPTARAAGDATPERLPALRTVMSAQFMLAIVFYFFLFAVTQLVRLTTPISLKEIAGEVTPGVVGVAFTLGGIGSLVGVLVVARRWAGRGHVARALTIGCTVAGLLHVALAFSSSVPVFVTWLVLISVAEAAMLPVTNTLIAANVPRARRGTAFGVAGSAQALAFMAGPVSAAAFAATSLKFGYVLLGVLFLGFGLAVRRMLREPPYSDEGSRQGAAAIAFRTEPREVGP